MVHKFKTKSPLVYFVGLDVPNHIKDEIYYFLKENAKNYNQYVDWIDSREYHITIAYLGRITEEQRRRLITVSDKIIVPPFNIHMQGIGFYPPGKTPKRIWLGIGRGREMVKAFGEKIRKEVATKAGLLPRDSFFPHITIGKLKQFPEDKTELFKFVQKNWDYPFGAFQVNSFHLYRITKSGYTYNHEIKLKSKCAILCKNS